MEEKKDSNDVIYEKWNLIDFFYISLLFLKPSCVLVIFFYESSIQKHILQHWVKESFIFIVFATESFTRLLTRRI